MERKNSKQMFQLMIEKIKQEEIDYNDFLGSDLTLIIETHEELVNSIIGYYARMSYNERKNNIPNEEKLNQYSDKRISFKKLKLELAKHLNDIEFQKQAIEYLSRESKEVHHIL